MFNVGIADARGRTGYRLMAGIEHEPWESTRVKGFRDFITRGNLIDLAVAVVIGTAFTTIVTAIVKDFITPLIEAIVGGKSNSFESLTFTIRGSKFAYGDLINAIVTFLIIAAVVYFLIVAPMAKIVLRLHGAKEATERDCPECLSSIPIAARRCKYCTVELAPYPRDRADHGYRSGLGPGPGRPEPRRSWQG